MRLDELKTATAPVTVADATVGSAVPVDFVRNIYRVRFINSFAGANQLLIGSRENGAGVTANLDTLQAAVTLEMITDPDELKEDAAPLYVVSGGPSRGPSAAVPPATSLVRMATSAGNGIVTYWYTDEESNDNS